MHGCICGYCAAALAGCANYGNADTVRLERIDSLGLVKTGEIRLALDEETTPMMQSTFYVSEILLGGGVVRMLSVFVRGERHVCYQRRKAYQPD